MIIMNDDDDDDDNNDDDDGDDDDDDDESVNAVAMVMMYTGDTGKHGDECCVWAACAARARRGPRAPRAGRVPRGPRAGRAPRGPSAARGPRGPREPRGPGAWSAPLFIETTLNSISTLQHLTTRTASHRPEPSKPREGGGG